MRPRTLALAALFLPSLLLARSDATPDKALAGRVAGPPRDCLSSFERDRDSQIFRSGDILFGGRSSTLFLNRPQGCPTLRPDLAISTVSPTGQLCRGDIIRVFDPVTGINYGSCPLGAFVPYGRPHK